MVPDGITVEVTDDDYRCQLMVWEAKSSVRSWPGTRRAPLGWWGGQSRKPGRREGFSGTLKNRVTIPAPVPLAEKEGSS